MLVASHTRNIQCDIPSHDGKKKTSYFFYAPLNSFPNILTITYCLKVPRASKRFKLMDFDD